MEQGHPRQPVLKSLAKSEIVRFKKEYADYVRDCEAINRGRVKNAQIVVREWSGCVDSDLLEEISQDVELEDIQGEEAYEQALRSFLEGILTKETFSEARLSLEKTISKVRLDDSVTDSRAKILMFKTNSRKALKENGMDPEEVYQDSSKFGRIVRLLVDNDNCLNPPEIRSWVRYMLEGEKHGKMLFTEFSDMLEEKCQQVEAVI